MTRDYSLVEAAKSGAQNDGGVSWFRPRIEPATIRALMEKSDAIATRDAVLWIGFMAFSAGIAIALWPSWWSVPFWLIYGVLYGSGADSRWHECGHKTAFRTAWKNEVIYQIACFMMMRNPAVWRASHVRHHTDTIIVGRDPGIIALRPPDLWDIALKFIGVVEVAQASKRMALHASGRIHEEEACYLREQDYPKVFLIARIWLMIYGATLAVTLWFGTLIPVLLIGLPRIYGAWHHVMTGLLQHLGLAENVTDRLTAQELTFQTKAQPQESPHRSTARYARSERP